MNYPELFYKTIVFFFSNIWVYLGLLMFILTVRGDVTRFFVSVKGYFKSLIVKFAENKAPDRTKYNNLK